MTRRRSRTLARPMPLAIGCSSRSSRNPIPSSSTSIMTRAVLAPAADDDRAGADLARQAVLDRVLDERLQDHARHDHVDGVGRNLLAHAQLRPEAHDLDVEVLVDRLELLPQRDEMLLAAQQTAQEAGQLVDQRSRRLWLRANQRRDRRERVEEEMRIDLALERLDLRGEQELLLLLQRGARCARCSRS